MLLGHAIELSFAPFLFLKFFRSHFDVVDKKTNEQIEKLDCEDYALRLQRKALLDFLFLLPG